MRKLFFVLAFAGISVASMAQDVVYDKYSVATNSFWDNWFVQVGGQWNVFYGNQEHGLPPKGEGHQISRNIYKTERANAGIAVAVGKWFTPGIGVRIKASGIWGKGIAGERGKAYDYNYKGILAYDCGSEEFDALFIVSDLAAQLGTEPQTYVQKMWYNPIDGMLYWAGVFDNLDYVVIDVANGIMAKAGSNADEITVLYTPYEITVEPEGLPGDVDCNGEVTMADVTILAMYLNGENPEITEQGMINADANQDGTVDIRDIAAIYAIISAS